MSTVLMVRSLSMSDFFWAHVQRGDYDVRAQRFEIRYSELIGNVGNGRLRARL